MKNVHNHPAEDVLWILVEPGSLSTRCATRLSSIPAKKSCQTHVEKDNQIDLKHLLQFPVAPSLTGHFAYRFISRKYMY